MDHQPPPPSWRFKTRSGCFGVQDITKNLKTRGHDAVITEKTISGATELLSGQRAEYIEITNEASPNWRPMLIAAETQFVLNTGPSADFSLIKTRLVYFINCYVNRNFIYLFTSQMQELFDTGLIQGTSCSLYIVSSGAQAHKSILGAELEKIFGGSPYIQHEHTEDNQYEYPGIHKVWQLAQNDDEAFILYFHGRGLSHLKLGRGRRNRQPVERALFRAVISEWRENLLWLIHLTSADKLGMTSGGNGWIWFNFWWVRSSYAAQLEEPVITTRRHYYEDWLGRYQGNAEPGQYQSTMEKCINVASFPLLKKYNLGSDFSSLNGEIHLGLPFGKTKYFLKRFGQRLKRFFQPKA